MIRAALDAWSAVANVHFLQVAATGTFATSPADMAIGLSGGLLEQVGGVSIGVFPDPMPPAQAKAFICLCEDVTSKDIALSVAEGYDSSELCKRYTTVTMGPCQGRMCQLTSVRIMGAETGQTLEQVGLTTARPP